MKAKRFFSVLTFLFVLSVLINCSGPSSGGTGTVVVPPPPPPPPPKVEPPVLTVDYSTDTLGYGDLAAFSWKVTKDPNAKVKLNGNTVPMDGSYTSDRLFAKTTYKLVATGKGGSDSKSFNINVGDWSTSTFGLLTHNYWLFKKTGYQIDSINGQIQFHMYSDQEVDQNYFKDKYYYTKDNKYKMYRSGELVADTGFNLIKNPDGSYSFQIEGGHLFDIIILDKDNMTLYEHSILFYDSNGDGIIDSSKPILFKWVYIRGN